MTRTPRPLAVLRSTLALGALLALAACSGPVTSPAFVSGSYTPAVLNQAAASGGLQTAIYGNPFNDSQAAVDEVVVRALEDGAAGAPDNLEFKLKAPETPQRDYRVVVLFDAAPSAQAQQLCFSPAQKRAKSEPGRVSVLAALCIGTDRQTSTRGWASGVEGPDDPAFRRLMLQVAREIFPPRGFPFESEEGDQDFDL